MDFSGISRPQVETLVFNLLAVDAYKPLGVLLGGWVPVAGAVMAAIQGAALVGWSAFEAGLIGALKTMGNLGAGMVNMLTDFVADLVNGLIVIGAGNQDGVLADAAQGAMTGGGLAAQMLWMVGGGAVVEAGGAAARGAAETFMRGAGLVLQQERGGGPGSNARGWGLLGVGIIAIAAVAVAAVTFGSAAAVIGVAVIASGAVIGAGLAVYYGMGEDDGPEQSGSEPQPEPPSEGRPSREPAGAAPAPDPRLVTPTRNRAIGHRPAKSQREIDAMKAGRASYNSRLLTSYLAQGGR
ncbi:hypothetical protein [Sagittula stellata]|uniref:Uncharacterized protein n=1 Tax=Sagittula stellata (strain ATCC 700073 / DSM 11524 / E-37) TaxID=388399 RepID=A3JYX1_SAGS3|nr:hypothetical protein [Sagittula stellata]EBA09674.1 hypothetical protein SSE37_07698 [Sagittula stellata E-37]